MCSSLSGFTDDDVRAAEQSVHDPSSFSNGDTVEEPELIQVRRRQSTAKSQYQIAGLSGFPRQNQIMEQIRIEWIRSTGRVAHEEGTRVKLNSFPPILRVLLSNSLSDGL